MPPKAHDARNDTATLRERQIAAAAHARASKKNGQHTMPNGIMKYSDMPRINDYSDAVAAPQNGTGMQWDKASLELLNTYRVSHNLSSPAAFTSSYRQALLTNPGIGRQSPTMARKKEKRRVSKDQLALAVRKNFNGAAVNEMDVVAEMVYKIQNKDKAFRMRSAPNAVKKS
ncbi:Putative SAP30 domain superfamily protein [Septoria linicola]|uniref:SAP30 domain superfamily protein n=1 Tax=Septoria linicola TaxID=215465 RepID=A0A9Q9AXF2_9PEZI|nr:Putative SAP30 domain superfamily protein [Septoria linicola]